tara:strand:- start:217 stop:519 length:303 start_codon:yes stop_codon:yes gene_type:complete
MKKKRILTACFLFASTGILFAGGDCEGYASLKEITKIKPEIVLTSNNLQLFKYSDNKGNTRFTIKNLEGKIIAENMSKLRLRIDFPEIEKKNSLKSIAKL